MCVRECLRCISFDIYYSVLFVRVTVQCTTYIQLENMILFSHQTNIKLSGFLDRLRKVEPVKNTMCREVKSRQ